jgi:septal ring factor EnvC (AmiA/AmiB activator)
MTITKDLQAISKQITKLAKQAEKLAAELAKAEKSQAKSVKTKATVKKATVKRAQKTATDTVLAIINRSKKGVGTAALMKKTGFDQKKVRNILHRTYKQGKITRIKKGIYVGAK